LNKFLNLCLFIFIFKGAYRNEELISWSLTKYNGSIGTVFTKPEARGLGLATILNVRVASKLFEQQDRVHGFVAHDNIASLRMLEKLGYHRTCDVDWLIFTSE
jgi:predicted GNAT family acetyltransferase